MKRQLVKELKYASVMHRREDIVFVNVEAYFCGKTNWGGGFTCGTRAVQDKLWDRSPHLSEHSGIRQQKAVLVGGPKVWAI